MSQYNIIFKGICIEHTGYFSSLEEAKQYVKGRYQKSDLYIRKSYPEYEDTMHKVWD